MLDQFEFTSIAEALAAAQNNNSQDKRISFYSGTEKPDQQLSLLEFSQKVTQYGAALAEAGLSKGERVAVIVTEPEEFLLTFFAAIHIGAVPVPISPPVSHKQFALYLERVSHTLKASGAELLVVSAYIEKHLAPLLEKDLKSIIRTEQLANMPRSAPLASVQANELAFLQFTSGSTSNPKGVMVSHENLFHNTVAIYRAFGSHPESDVFCSWLPLFHDMGLIGFAITPLLFQTSFVIMQPLTFIKQPVHWLKAIDRYQATASFAPNFAYALCSSRIKDEELQGIDISSWRVAGCAAEPIQYSTLMQFAERFSKIGFCEEAFLTAYGLAESTLAVSFGGLDEPATAEVVDGSRLANERVAVPISDSCSEDPQFVSCGQVIPYHSVKICKVNGEACAEREVGEVFVSGPSVADGYFRNPEATADTFPDRWLRTGDLGYLANSELYICGRIKELIIVAGRNYHPTDIEWAAAQHDEVRSGAVVAFSVQSPEQAEKLVVCAETHEEEKHYPRLKRKIAASIRQVLGLLVSDVVLMIPGTLPKTSSGKLQRVTVRKAYETALHEIAVSNRTSKIEQSDTVSKREDLFIRRLGSPLF